MYQGARSEEERGKMEQRRAKREDRREKREEKEAVNSKRASQVDGFGVEEVKGEDGGEGRRGGREAGRR